MCKKFGLVFLTILFCQGAAQILNSSQRDTIRQTIRRQFGEGAANLNLNTFNTTVLVKGDTFFNPGGFNYVFQLTKAQAFRVDRSYFHGSTFNRYLFVYKEIMYQLGGYGMFQTSNNLLRFSFIDKEWEMVRTTGEKPGFIQGITLVKDSVLYLLNSRRGGNGVEPDSIDNQLYQLNLNTFLWTKHPIQKEIVGYKLNYETPNYLFCYGERGLLVIKKPFFKYEVIKNLGESFLKDTPDSISGDCLIFPPRLNSLQKMNYILNLDSLWLQQASLSRDLLPASMPIVTNAPRRNVFIITITILLFLVVILLIKTYKSNKPMGAESKDKQESLASGHYEKLLSANSSLLTMEELDELLDIEHMEADSRKLKRFRLLQEINDEYPGLITRIKDGKDRRRFLYKINVQIQKLK